MPRHGMPRTGARLHSSIMKTHKLLLLALACTWAMGASAQWQWVDKDGRKVFSDRPPPQDIPEKSILKQPRNAPPPPSMATPAAAAAQAAAPSGKDRQLEENKAKADAQDAARKKAEDERVAKARADNCARARQAKLRLAPGQLVGYVNDKGERGFMDEAAREAELQRADDIIAADCR